MPVLCVAVGLALLKTRRAARVAVGPAPRGSPPGAGITENIANVPPRTARAAALAAARTWANARQSAVHQHASGPGGGGRTPTGSRGWMIDVCRHRLQEV